MLMWLMFIQAPRVRSFFATPCKQSREGFASADVHTTDPCCQRAVFMRAELKVIGIVVGLAVNSTSLINELTVTP
jgi:hypothetical protein